MLGARITTMRPQNDVQVLFKSYAVLMHAIISTNIMIMHAIPFMFKTINSYSHCNHKKYVQTIVILQIVSHYRLPALGRYKGVAAAHSQSPPVMLSETTCALLKSMHPTAQSKSLPLANTFHAPAVLSTHISGYIFFPTRLCYVALWHALIDAP